MNKLRYILQSKYLIKILVFIFLIINIIYTNYYPFKSKYNSKENTFTGIITKYEVEENKIKIQIKGKEKLIINYHSTEPLNLSYGDKILVKGTLSKPNKNTNFNTFNYQKYLYNKKIYYIVTATSIDKIANNKNYLYTIKNILYQRITNLKSNKYIKTLLFCNNTLDKEIKDSYRINGISHLFSVSGMHINIFINIIYLYLNKVTYNKKIKYLITDLFIIIYLILFPSSSLLRTALTTIIFSINYILKLKIKKIDILLLTLLISMIINPFIIYDLGYIYSYIITFFLVLNTNTIKKKNHLQKTTYITILAFITSIPITIYTSYEINIISIILNIFLVPIISIILLPLTILTLIIPILDNILYPLTTIIETISLSISKINITKIIIPKPHLLIIIIYYLILLLSHKYIKLKYLIPLIILSVYISPSLDNNLKVVMFSVGEADTHLIRFPYNKANILIDTGESQTKITSEIIPSLKSIGIKKIDYLIITHGDKDHLGGASSLINNFKVKKVILNCGTYNELEETLIKELKQKQIKYYNCIKELNINNQKIYFLNTKEYDNENNNSSVIYFTYNHIKFLFMGDAEKEKELDIIDKYNIKDVTFLKVGHHGSDTSSNKDFITIINPKYSLISVGKNNRYNHPKETVLNTLKKSQIYRTDINGSVEITINKKNYQIKTCH